MVNKQDQVEAELVLHKLRVYTSPIRCLIGAMCPLTQHIGDSHLHFSTGACCVCVCVCVLAASCFGAVHGAEAWWKVQPSQTTLLLLTTVTESIYERNLIFSSVFTSFIFNLFVQINNWNFFKERKKRLYKIMWPFNDPSYSGLCLCTVM